MNAINLSAEVAQLATQSKPTATKLDNSASFANVLMEKSQADTAQVVSQNEAKNDSTVNTEATESTKTPVNLDQLLSLLNSGATSPEISKMLDGLTNEQTQGLFDALEKIIEVITEKLTQTTESSANQSTTKDSSTDIISMLKELFSQKNPNENSTEIADAVLQQVIAMLQNVVNPQMTSEQATQTVTQSQPILAVGTTQNNPQPEILASGQEITTQVSQVTSQTATAQNSSEIAVLATPQTESTFKPSTLQEVKGKLEKFLSVVQEKLNAGQIPKEITVIEKSSGSDDGGKLSAETQLKKLAIFGGKTAKTSTEFSELIASSQNTKQVTQPAVEEKVVEIPVEKQISGAITTQISSKVTDVDTKELILKLNPVELGEVSIKLVKTGGEITVSIMAQNEATNKLLQEKLPTLLANLQATNGEVKDVQIVQPNQNAAGFMNGFSLSDSNSNSQNNAKQPQNFSQQTNTPTEEIEEIKEYRGEGKLWQTA